MGFSLAGSFISDDLIYSQNYSALNTSTGKRDAVLVPHFCRYKQIIAEMLFSFCALFQG